MADDWRTLDALQRDLAELKRQVAGLTSTLTDYGSNVSGSEALRAAGRHAAYYSEEAQRAARRHPVATGFVALAALGAVVFLTMYGNRDRHSNWWH